MNKKSLLTVSIALFAFSFASAKAKIPLCFPCETVETVQELPTDSEIQKLAGQKVNLSYIYDEYGLLWMSLWNTNGRYVLTDISNNTYFELDDQTADILKEKHNFDVKTAEQPMTFWKKIGGKLVFLILVGLGIWGSIPSKSKDVKATNV
ncbi:hypothetical protein [Flavobacterium sp. NKUCC04_CG]|uniref:hypothetical protein n=1 Tax=Flavobacterium sp. NKUCC04_CG TaxID=2842121 RepID=UPI001C5BCF63|nr:hypothetical protein [Flavobacterium sp. NKUCC04_CG]MBW3518070.1 hypothetical protein [Flavobacterium sp. NKUCC04_CG]